jgi:signal transduction histidine kinase
MQRDLEHARESAELANAAKSMFLANMSHELRTPLTSVVAASEMLAGTDLTRQQERLLDSVVRSGRRLRLLVEDILTFSRIEAGKVDVDAVEFDLKPVLVEVVEFAREQAARKGLDFAWAFHPDVPSTMVGDSTKLFQVLSNLLDNAIKFTESGSVRMSVAHAAAGDAGERVTFTVTDTGIGMDPDQVEQLFQPFSQADPSTTRKYGGAGLGLAICKELVGLMDGTIRVESVEGSGSRFAVVLPRRAPPDREPTAQRSPDVNGAGVVAVE